jgi:hypothetical protein
VSSPGGDEPNAERRAPSQGVAGLEDGRSSSTGRPAGFPGRRLLRRWRVALLSSTVLTAGWYTYLKSERTENDALAAIGITAVGALAFVGWHRFTKTRVHRWLDRPGVFWSILGVILLGVGLLLYAMLP